MFVRETVKYRAQWRVIKTFVVASYWGYTAEKAIRTLEGGVSSFSGCDVKGCTMEKNA
jgi:hypothetical protein